MIARSLLADYDDARAAADIDRLGAPMARRALISPVPQHLRHRRQPRPPRPDDPPQPSSARLDLLPRPPAARLLRADRRSAGRSPPAPGCRPGADCRPTPNGPTPPTTSTSPTLVVLPLGDTDAYPDEQHEIFDRIPAADKTFTTLDHAHHYLLLLPGATEQYNPRDKAGEIVTTWLAERMLTWPTTAPSATCPANATPPSAAPTAASTTKS